MFAGHREQLVLQLFFADLRESRWDHHRTGNAFFADFLHGLGAELGGHRKHRDIHLTGNILHALVGFPAEDLVGLGVDGIDIAREAAVDDVLHDRVADLALAFRGPDHCHRPWLHDPLHRGEDLCLGRTEDFFLRFEADAEQSVYRCCAFGTGKDGVQVDFCDLRKVADQIGYIDDDLRQGITVGRRRSAYSLQHRRRLDTVKHG